MYSHDGTWSFLKLVVVLGFAGLAVWWLQGVIGGDYTVLFILALMGAGIFAGGALFAHMNQKQTLDAISKFNAQDAQIDRHRMQSFNTLATGQTAMQKAAAQLTVLDAKRVHQIAGQQSKLLLDAERSKWNAQQRQPEPENADLWNMDDEGDNTGIQEWR